MKTINLLPNAEGSIQEWYIFPNSGTHWEKVNDIVERPDEDIKYVWANINEKIEEFNHETSDLLKKAIIQNVRLVVRARKTDTLDDMGIELGLKIKDIRYHTYTALPLTTKYDNYYADWNHNPVLSSDTAKMPWTPEMIDSLQSSVQAIMSEKTLHGQLRITQIYFIITYINLPEFPLAEASPEELV